MIALRPRNGQAQRLSLKRWYETVTISKQLDSDRRAAYVPRKSKDCVLSCGVWCACAALIYIVWSPPTLHPRRPRRLAMPFTLSPFSVTYACSCHALFLPLCPISCLCNPDHSAGKLFRPPPKTAGPPPHRRPGPPRPRAQRRPQSSDRVRERGIIQERCKSE